MSRFKVLITFGWAADGSTWDCCLFTTIAADTLVEAVAIAMEKVAPRFDGQVKSVNVEPVP